jgi:CTP synthase (UTP-ammonia lyase)
MATALIALVGDYNPEVLAHRAIEKCFTLAKRAGSYAIEPRWVSTESIVPGDGRCLELYSAVWCVPASPYQNKDGALWAIQYARTNSIPFLGTCGGYQHALLEYARNVIGLTNAAHAELDPTGSVRLLDRMQCPLIERSEQVYIVNPAFRSVYGADSGLEGFHCSFGLNPVYEHIFAGSDLEIIVRSAEGHARGFRLKSHPFFVGTQFQPERTSLSELLHPLVAAFYRAASAQPVNGS